MEGRIARAAALLLSLFLVLSYFVFPWTEERNQDNNSGRNKLEMAAGDTESWYWVPELPGSNKLRLQLSGVKGAELITINVSVGEENKEPLVSEKYGYTDFEQSSTIVVHGDFQTGKEYVLIVSVSGEGSIKLKGMKLEDGSFEPYMMETGVIMDRNPVHLFFAVGFVLLALVPVRRKSECKPRFNDKQSWVARALPWGTLFLILTVGLLVDLRKPVFITVPQDWMTWDEDTHLLLVSNMNLFAGGGLRSVLKEAITWNPGYLPLAIGYNLGELLNPFFKEVEGLSYRCAIIVSTVCYASMCALAVRTAPRYKVSFMAAGTLPTLIFQATSMTYDPVVSASLILGLALLLKILDQDEKMSEIQAITVLTLLSFGTVAKPAYSAVLISLFLIPADKFENKGIQRFYKVIIALMLIWCFTAVAMPGAYDNVIEGDKRLGDTNSRAQLQGILSDPIGNGLEPFRFLFRIMNNGFAVYGIAFWGSVGNAFPSLNELYLAVMLIAAPLCTCGELWDKKSLLTIRRRIIFMLAAFLSIMILIYAQYLVSTTPGEEIFGMHPRYFAPVWLPVMLALMWPRKIRRQIGQTAAGDVMTVIIFLICSWTNVQNAIMHLSSFGLI